jgi:hypothetical protein
MPFDDPTALHRQTGIPQQLNFLRYILFLNVAYYKYKDLNIKKGETEASPLIEIKKQTLEKLYKRNRIEP